MINNVSFTGREGMLVKPFVKSIEQPIEQQVIKASTYIEAALPKAEEISKPAIEAIYSSPYAPINTADAVCPTVVGKFLNYLG